jgi:hypothetical protein
MMRTPCTIGVYSRRSVRHQKIGAIMKRCKRPRSVTERRRSSTFPSSSHSTKKSTAARWTASAWNRFAAWMIAVNV